MDLLLETAEGENNVSNLRYQFSVFTINSNSFFQIDHSESINGSNQLI